MNKRHLSPLQAIRKFCVTDCMAGSAEEVKLCVTPECPLYNLRFGRSNNSLRPLKQIHLRCFDCSCFSKKEVKECWDKNCYLYPFRMGKNPHLVGKRGRGHPGSLEKYRKESLANLEKKVEITA